VRAAFPIMLMKQRRFIRSLILTHLIFLVSACHGGEAITDRTDRVPACTAIGQTWTSPSDGATLVCVPAGEFLMGAATDDALAREDEKPQHRVFVDAYWIDRTEVTNAEFARCIAAGACRPKVYDSETKNYVAYAVHPDYQNYPAFLYEDEAPAAYCQWVGRRLPTEAEWEKAARGTDGRLFPWGDTLDCSHANYLDCVMNAAQSTDNHNGPGCGYSSFCNTTPVDADPAGASPYGALNLAGNVWEWVADWYAADYYRTSPTHNPIGPASGENRVRRGGGNKSWEQDLRVTARAGGNVSHFFDGQIGFRCALSVAQ
jgi:eukaryotic-like serine/threonine-protein kinase